MLVPLTVTLASGAMSLTIQRRAAASAWASSNDGQYQLSTFDPPVLGASNDNGTQDWNFQIFEKSGQKQTVKGFGACVTDSTVTVLNELSDATREDLLKDIMTSDGLNFSLMRHTIGSSDLSADPPYTYDDNGGQVDESLSSFSLGNRGQAMASMLAEMKNLQSDMVLLGSSWAPPAWMQEDEALVNATNGQPNVLNHQYADELGQYFVKYIQAYEAQGVTIDYITIQNEPQNNKSDMPTMVIEAEESALLIQNNVGPALRDANLQTSVWALDHNTDYYSYMETVTQTASDFVSGAAWHCYSGNDEEHWQTLSQYHDEFPNEDQYMTECYTAIGITDWVNSSNFNLLPLQNWANGIIAWALGTYTGGGPTLPGTSSCHKCTGLVTIDPGSGTYIKTIDYYMMGQFSKFMTKGGRVLNGTGSGTYGDSGVYMVSSLNPDGTRVVVIQNQYDHSIFVQVATESESQTWNGQVVGQSVTTWILPSA